MSTFLIDANTKHRRPAGLTEHAQGMCKACARHAQGMCKACAKCAQGMLPIADLSVVRSVPSLKYQLTLVQNTGALLASQACARHDAEC
eukprot:1161040-Pelagomonas_calceolata.AAC.10